MVAGQIQPAGDKVPIAETLIAAVRTVVARRADLLRLGLALVLVVFFFGALGRERGLNIGTTPGQAGAVASPARTLYTLVIMGLDTLFISIFAVLWHRLILLGPNSVGGGLGLRVGTRELLYWGRMWLCVLILVMVAGAVAVVATALYPSGKAKSTALGVVAIICIVAVPYCCGRWGPIFAATAIDQELSFVRAWRVTAGNGGRLFGINLLTGLGWLAVASLFHVVALGLGLTAAAPYATLFTTDVISCVALTVLVTINALVFRRLTGGPV